MIISRTPFRMSFFGGGTDYPAWFLDEGGAVLSTTIDKYCYVSCRVLPPFFSVRHRIVWSHIETVSTIDEILHPAIREGLRYLGFDDSVGLEIQHQGDLPARSGIGSSSSFTVGLVKVLAALRGEMLSKGELARLAIELEQERLKEYVGLQDTLAAAYGGFNSIRFLQNGDVRVEPVTVSVSRIADLHARLLLFYTGSSRLGPVVAADIVANIPSKKAELRRMREMVDEALSVLNGRGSLDDFGRLLDEGWALKRGLSASVSTQAIEAIYRKAREHGALGGKLLGAGGSGFMLFYAPPDRHDDIVHALERCLHVPFAFEADGSTVVYYSPEAPVLSRVRKTA